ncbi:MAG: T9SS type A sorting domain-containing protein, partial [candidate division WOR-3 bacterium]
TWRTKPGKYIFAGYTQLLYDKNYENDSCQQAIFILNGSGVAEGGFRNAGCRSWFTLLPNPLTKGYGLLSYSVPQAGNARLKVFDVSGRTVMSLSFVASHSGEKRLDLRRLSAGVYWVKFETPSEEAIQKLIIR